MSVVAAVLVVAGVVLALIGGIGLLRFSSPYARFHAAGKASPISFLLVAAGMAVEEGAVVASQLAIAAVALVVTLPVAMHLLYRASHRTGADADLVVDELGDPPSDPPASS